MTTTQADFEQLFRACYWGEAPWLALADWLVETGHKGTARTEVPGSAPRIEAVLTVLWPAGFPLALHCYFEVPQFGTQQVMWFGRDVFCAGFPAWIANEVELLRMDLRRSGYLKQLT